MKKITAIVLAIGMLMSTAAYAYDFPQPDWGTLLDERKAMSTTQDFELYVEGRPETAPYYGARLEPRAGTYIGMAADGADGYTPLGSYLTYIESFYQDDLYYPSKEMIKNDNVVAMIGWTVNSLGDVNYDAIRTILDKLNSYNKPMYIRFANEMNVSPLGDEPSQYVQVFRNVANMIHEYSNFAVVWSPNDLGALDRPFDLYYPGDDYVDWVGVSCYMPKYFTNEPNTTEINATYFMTGDYAWATNKLKPIMEFMRKKNIQKPVMISEGGVARYNSFGDDYTGWHEPRLRNMLWNVIMKYPQIKMINYFNVNFNNFGEHYYISDYQSSVDIFKEAAGSGAYIRSANASPSFVFSPANNGETLAADSDGIVNLYTCAYFFRNSDISVNYKIDGEWYHAANAIPYKCRLNINNISDGQHNMTIEVAGASKSYTFYKRGQYIRFGQEPDASAANVPAVTQQDISVYVNGEKLSFDQPPVIVNDRTLVPMRAIFEALGATVDWNGDTKTATAVRGNESVSLTIDDNHMYKTSSGNTAVKELDVSAQLISSRTMVPVRAIAEAFGSDVEWDGDTRSVIITE